jgi:hypothetical protein
MLVRIYEACWVVFFIAAILTLLMGNFGSVSAVAFGFVAFGLVFMGMISILPDVTSHPSHK